MTLIHLVRLKVFGFPHPGRERWRARVIKRPWRVIPGSTLYGALATALIKLDCDEESLKERDPEKAYKTHKNHGCGYGKLLNLLRGEEPRIRFSPLVPVEGEVKDARGYCRAAQALISTPILPSAEGVRRPTLFTTPHAPINRQRMVIHGDLLHGVTSHQPFQSYVGFIVEEVVGATESILHQLKRAFRALPFVPFGGRGKYSFAEAEVVKSINTEDFTRSLKERLKKKNFLLQLLTPVILENKDNWLFLNYKEMMIPRFKRYKVWRTGLYVEDNQLKMYAHEQTRAMLGIPEGSWFKLKEGVDIKTLVEKFIKGIGNPNWTCLGWGQVIFYG